MNMDEKERILLISQVIWDIVLPTVDPTLLGSEFRWSIHDDSTLISALSESFFPLVGRASYWFIHRK
jgi:hypothetical protein